METPQRYWSGVYWDGIEPAAIGAVELSDAASDEHSIQHMLEYTRQLVQQQQQQQQPVWCGESDGAQAALEWSAVEDYCVSIVDMREERQLFLSSQPSLSAQPHASSSSLPPSCVACSGECVVVRLWHCSVFEGARESGTGDPGARCVDCHFTQQAGSDMPSFAHSMSLDDTTSVIERR